MKWKEGAINNFMWHLPYNNIKPESDFVILLKFYMNLLIKSILYFNMCNSNINSVKYNVLNSTTFIALNLKIFFYLDVIRAQHTHTHAHVPYSY